MANVYLDSPQVWQTRLAGHSTRPSSPR